MGPVSQPSPSKVAPITPIAAEEQDQSGALPLHWAVWHQMPLEIVRALLEAYPAGAAVKDTNGNLLLHWVLRENLTGSIL